MIATAYVIIVQLLFKDHHKVFGKLLTFYNLTLVVTSTSTIALQLMHYWITANSQIICHTTTIITSLAFPATESYATNILTHSAYLMYRCYHLKSRISKKTSQFLYRCYTTYAAFTLVLLFFVIIAYDWRTGNGKYTILPNGHCFLWSSPSYNTWFFTIFIAVINKLLQMVTFSAFLVYHYKFNKNVHAAQVSLRYSRQLYRITIAMGATVGISHFIFIFGFAITEFFMLLSLSVAFCCSSNKLWSLLP